MQLAKWKILKTSNCNEYNECNFPFFNVYWLSIFKLFNYTYSDLDELLNDYSLSSIISKNEPLLIIGMYNCNEWLNNKIKSLIPERDQLSSLLSNMMFPIKLTKKVLCECNDDQHVALERLKRKFYHFGQINRVKFNLSDSKVDTVWNGKVGTKIACNFAQSSKKFYDSSLDYYKNANADDDDGSNGGTNCARYKYPQCRFLSRKDLNTKRNKMENY